MALVPIISQTWDTTSYVNPTRMNNIENNIAIVSKATGVEYSSGVSVKDKIDEAFKSFDDWALISNFSANNDTWQSSNDGFISIRATNVTGTSASYCYIYDTNVSSNVPFSTISLPSGGGGLTYAFVIPAIKGHTYKILMGGSISAIVAYFLKLNK